MLPLLSLVLISCAKELPTPPVGNLYLHDASTGMALCSTLGSGIPCNAIAIKDTDKYFMLDGATYKSVVDYIDALVYEIKKPQSADKKQAAIIGLEQLSAELKAKQSQFNGN